MEPNKKTAIYKLAPGCSFSVRDPAGTAEIVNWEDNGTGTTQPTEKAIQTELDRQIVEYSALQYQRDRTYPSTGDQLDMQYWDQVNGTTTWQDSVAKVKADNPK